jgi:hypothetical protein
VQADQRVDARPVVLPVYTSLAWLGFDDVLLVVDHDLGSPDVHGDELAVGVRELRWRYEPWDRARRRVREGFHDELVEVLLDLIARLGGERADEVGEEVVLGGADEGQ